MPELSKIYYQSSLTWESDDKLLTQVWIRKICKQREYTLTKPVYMHKKAHK